MSDRQLDIPCTVDGALVALRETLEHAVPGASSFAHIKTPLRTLCLRAHDEGVAPEHLLVRLKQTLNSVPGFDGRHLAAYQDEMRERIVSFTINTYFSDVEGT